MQNCQFSLPISCIILFCCRNNQDLGGPGRGEQTVLLVDGVCAGSRGGPAVQQRGGELRPFLPPDVAAVVVANFLGKLAETVGLGSAEGEVKKAYLICAD